MPIMTAFHRSAHISTDPIIAGQWLKQGRLLAYPTESVWGMGCDAMNEQAVAKVLAIKQRDVNKGLIVLTDAIYRLAPLLASLTDKQRQTIKQSWQPPNCMHHQAITWLLPLNDAVSIPHWITGQHHCVAVRVIAHPLIQQVCRQMVSADNPLGLIVSTSCNPSGLFPANTLAEAFGYFGSHIGYLQGNTLGYQKPSQIQDAATGKILR